MLTIAISRLVKSNNASLRGMCIGYLDAVRCCYGQNFADEGVAEGEKFDIQFDPDTTSVSISGGTCTFKTNGSHRTVFLSQVFKDKIYRIEIKIHSWGSNDSLYFGFCPETKKQKAISNYITYSSGAGSGGSVAMFFSSSTLNTYCTGNGECGSNMWSTNPITSNSTVALELNMKAHTLHFFVNGKQLSNYFQHIPSMPLSFGITGNYSPKVQVMSVMNLSAPLAKSGGTAYLWM